jgi:hypothetical protein
MVAGAAGLVAQSGVKNLAAVALQFHRFPGAAAIRQRFFIPAHRTAALIAVSAGFVTQPVFYFFAIVTVLVRFQFTVCLKIGHGTCSATVAFIHFVFKPANGANPVIFITAFVIAKTAISYLV